MPHPCCKCRRHRPQHQRLAAPEAVGSTLPGIAQAARSQRCAVCCALGGCVEQGESMVRGWRCTSLAEGRARQRNAVACGRSGALHAQAAADSWPSQSSTLMAAPRNLPIVVPPPPHSRPLLPCLQNGSGCSCTSAATHSGMTSRHLPLWSSSARCWAVATSSSRCVAHAAFLKCLRNVY